MRAARTDANHTEVVKALRSAGAFVRSLAAVGDGMPDLLVTVNGRTALIEVKDGKKVKSAQKLTPDQIKFHAEWTGSCLAIVDGPEAALRVLNVMRFDEGAECQK